MYWNPWEPPTRDWQMLRCVCLHVHVYIYIYIYIYKYIHTDIICSGKAWCRDLWGLQARTGKSQAEKTEKIEREQERHTIVRTYPYIYIYIYTYIYIYIYIYGSMDLNSAIHIRQVTRAIGHICIYLDISAYCPIACCP